MTRVLSLYSRPLSVINQLWQKQGKNSVVKFLVCCFCSRSCMYGDGKGTNVRLFLPSFHIHTWDNRFQVFVSIDIACDLLKNYYMSEKNAPEIRNKLIWRNCTDLISNVISFLNNSPTRLLIWCWCYSMFQWAKK